MKIQKILGLIVLLLIGAIVYFYFFERISIKYDELSKRVYIVWSLDKNENKNENKKNEQNQETIPECGNGQIEGNEECDDGNNEDKDLCDNFCRSNATCSKGDVIFQQSFDVDLNSGYVLADSSCYCADGQGPIIERFLHNLPSTKRLGKYYQINDSISQDKYHTSINCSNWPESKDTNNWEITDCWRKFKCSK